jgi:hypothetical protein
MKKVLLGILAATGLALGAAACSQNSFGTVAVTKDPSAVSGCEKVADVTASPGRFDESSAQTQLTRAAQAKGANTLLVADETGNKGTAYRCSMPSVASGAKSGNSAAH